MSGVRLDYDYARITPYFNESNFCNVADLFDFKILKGTEVIVNIRLSKLDTKSVDIFIDMVRDKIPYEDILAKHSISENTFAVRVAYVMEQVTATLNNCSEFSDTGLPIDIIPVTSDTIINLYNNDIKALSDIEDCVKGISSISNVSPRESMHISERYWEGNTAGFYEYVKSKFVEENYYESSRI